MSEENRPEPGESPSTPTDTDWGADWESAFEAEEDIFFSEGEDFFLDEGESEEKAGDEPAGAAAPPKTATPEAAAEEEEGALAAKGGAAALLGSWLAFVVDLPGTVRNLLYQFTTLPRKKQILVAATAAVVLLGSSLTLWLFSSKHPSEEAPSQQLAAPATGGTGGGEPPVMVSPETEKLLADIPEAVEPQRLKWRLPSFVIPAKPPKPDQPPAALVHVDITLVTILPPDQDLPKEKETFVRNLIYEFFANQPLSDLRRFSLARGEMQRKLRSWLEKQWPDAPIEAIVFDRYFVS